MKTDFFDLSIPLIFNGLQPNAFGSEPASAVVRGDTRNGSSVNFETYTFSPHCSGTHTECIGHITHERISVRACLQDVLIPAVLITVTPSTGTAESYSERQEGDRLITAGSIRAALNEASGILPDGEWALAIRTTPNTESKLSAVYDETNIPPYPSDEAMKLILENGVKHLLVDTPSIDRISDGGRLSNHRRFWNIPNGEFAPLDASRMNATITELIFVPDEARDGLYTLNLQIAPFETDAAPSRPILLPA